MFQLKIITPEKVLLEEDVESVEAPGVDGEFQVLAGHTPFLTGLNIGPLSFSKHGKKTVASISGGFCEVMPKETVILAPAAELSGGIDRKRAESAKGRAEKRIGSDDSGIDTERARMALMRALNRLNVADMK